MLSFLTQRTTCLQASQGGVSFTRSRFLSNAAINGSGGAIHVSAAASRIVLSSTILTANTAGGSGGGIQLLGTSSEMSVTNCSLSDNLAGLQNSFSQVRSCRPAYQGCCDGGMHSGQGSTLLQHLQACLHQLARASSASGGAMLTTAAVRWLWC